MSMSYEIVRKAMFDILRNLDEMPRHEILDLAALFETVEDRFDEAAEGQIKQETVWCYADSVLDLDDRAYEARVIQDKASVLLYALQDADLDAEFIERLEEYLQKMANAKIRTVVVNE